MSRRPKDIVASKIHDIGESISRKVFLKLPFSPTQLNLMNFFCLIIASFLFAFGQWKFNLWALAFILVATQFDYADGIVARERGLTNRFGAWFDPFLDLVGQHIILMGVCFGVMRNFDFNPWIVFLSFLGFWSLALSNTIGLAFNRVFGFDSYVGSQDFTSKFMGIKKTSFWERLTFNTIAPHRFLYFIIFTLRYFLVAGIIFNQMFLALFLITLFGLFRAFLMIWAYAFLLQGKRTNKVIKILAEIEEVPTK